MKPRAEPHTPLFVRGAGLSDRIEYRLIESPEERDAVYLMRYRAYLHGGMILPSESLRISDGYDDAPNAWTFGIYVDGELCSSLRLHVLTSEWRLSFATELFGDVLHPRLDRGEVFIDPARFVADPEKAQRFPELPFLTLRLVVMACEYFNADTGLALVRVDHQAFYRRVFRYKTIAEPRSLPNILKKLPLMATESRNLRGYVSDRFPIMRSSAPERRRLFERSGAHVAVATNVLPFERASIVPLA